MSQLDLLDALRLLALSEECPEIHGEELTVSHHAIQRYQERVEAMCRGRVERQLRRLVLDARWYPLPRPWTQIVIHPGSHYGYSPRRADVCLVERAGVVRTVLSRMTVSSQRSKMRRRVREPGQDGRSDRAEDRWHSEVDPRRPGTQKITFVR